MQQSQQLHDVEQRLQQERETVRAITAEKERVRVLAEQTVVAQQKQSMQQTEQLRQRVVEAELTQGHAQSIAARFESVNQRFSNERLT